MNSLLKLNTKNLKKKFGECAREKRYNFSINQKIVNKKFRCEIAW